MQTTAFSYSAIKLLPMYYLVASDLASLVPMHKDSNRACINSKYIRNQLEEINDRKYDKPCSLY